MSSGRTCRTCGFDDTKLREQEKAMHKLNEDLYKEAATAKTVNEENKRIGTERQRLSEQLENVVLDYEKFKANVGKELQGLKTTNRHRSMKTMAGDEYTGISGELPDAVRTAMKWDTTIQQLENDLEETAKETDFDVDVELTNIKLSAKERSNQTPLLQQVDKKLFQRLQALTNSTGRSASDVLAAACVIISKTRSGQEWAEDVENPRLAFSRLVLEDPHAFGLGVPRSERARSDAEIMDFADIDEPRDRGASVPT